MKDVSPRANELMIDRYLASPHYGEHRARYWLDAARYGDTHGIHYCPKQARISLPVLQTQALGQRNCCCEAEVYLWELHLLSKSVSHPSQDRFNTAIIVVAGKKPIYANAIGPHPVRNPALACPNQLRFRLSCSAMGTSGGVPKGFSSHWLRSR